MRKLVAPAIGAIASFVLIAASAADAKPKYTDIRVITNEAVTLAEHRQYTEKVKVQASTGADCFGESNPSSDAKYTLTEPNTLGALVDSASNDSDLDPLLITDAFFDDGFGFGVCDMGGLETEGFSYWYSAVNGTGSTTGPDLIPVKNGDANLWYLTTGEEPGFPSELVIEAPARVTANEPFEVTVTRLKADGSQEPAAGVTVSSPPTETNADGEATFMVGPGQATFQAMGGIDDVPSSEVPVCAAVEVSDCPADRGIDIFGSRGDDKIKSAAGPDRIDCGRGDDVVKKAQRSDEVDKSCEKVKRG
ncbi:MAG TPA: hypothetical protein VD766_11330 [Solirubrobacterales bacterium]|nr:hypothetical protein [Solirubrobacterales bacterium]